MKKYNYEKPIAELVVLSASDVLTDSVTMGGFPSDGDDLDNSMDRITAF